MIYLPQSLRGVSNGPMVVTPSLDPKVAAVFESYPSTIRAKLNRLRALILETAKQTDGVGPISETLKWGEPAYLTEATKSGSTIRLGWKPKRPDQYAIYFNCNTSLVEDFRAQFPQLNYVGNRAIVFTTKDKLPEGHLRQCFAAALTYHKHKRSRAKS